MENNEMNFVRTFNRNGKMLYESEHSSADSAHAEYKEIIRLLKNRNDAERITVTRWRYGHIMVIETV